MFVKRIGYKNPEDTTSFISNLETWRKTNKQISPLPYNQQPFFVLELTRLSPNDTAYFKFVYLPLHFLLLSPAQLLVCLRNSCLHIEHVLPLHSFPCRCLWCLRYCLNSSPLVELLLSCCLGLLYTLLLLLLWLLFVTINNLCSCCFLNCHSLFADLSCWKSVYLGHTLLLNLGHALCKSLLPSYSSTELFQLTPTSFDLETTFGGASFLALFLPGWTRRTIFQVSSRLL